MMPYFTRLNRMILLAVLLASSAVGEPIGSQTTRPAEDRLLEAARAGGAYLVRMTRPDGSFFYQYDPVRNRTSGTVYNMLRHAGAVYALCELYEVERDPAVLAAAERAIGYMKQRIEPYQGRDDQSVLIDGAVKIKLGGNALAIIALAQHAEATGSRDDLALMRRLGNWIVSTQNPAGEFRWHVIDARTGELDDHVSDYYPGEAVLALLRLHELDPDPRWLDSAESAARWLIEVRDAGKPLAELPHDHWLLYALNELHRKRPRRLWLDQAEKICEAMIRTQNGPDVARPQWAGGWDVPARTTPTSTRVEGLLAAAALLRDHGRGEAAGRVDAAAMRGIDFVLRAQHRPADGLPDRALGGFGEALEDEDVRIDYVQHAISALLAARRRDGR